MRVLFVTSEAYPLAKSGGLGDVSGALPAALDALGKTIVNPPGDATQRGATMWPLWATSCEPGTVPTHFSNN